jgi:biopolymer transport protein ExbD
VQQHVVELGPDGALRLDGEPVRLEALTQQLQRRDTRARQRSVIIRADKRLPYGRVIGVLGHVRQADIQDIAVAVR